MLLISGQHLAPLRSEIAYAASKGALQQVTATLSDELIDRGITVNTVNPWPYGHRLGRRRRADVASRSAAGASPTMPRG